MGSGMLTRLSLAVTVGFIISIVPVHAQVIRASQPRGVTLSIYDLDYGFVTERRSVQLRSGVNNVAVAQLPASLDRTSLSVAGVRGARFKVLEEQFQNDVSDIYALFSRFQGKTVEVITGAGTITGTLLRAPRAAGEGGGDSSLIIETEDGSAHVFQDLHQLEGVRFPEASQVAYLEPTLLWKVDSAEDEIQNFRLSYTVENLSWQASYDLILEQDGARGHLDARVTLRNYTGTTYENARVQLVATDKGRFPNPRNLDAQQRPSLRYAYGGSEPVFERTTASVSALKTYELPETIRLVSGSEKNVSLHRASEVPITTFYVYDGVTFDRFQRNRRNDWNYGTEYQPVVAAHLAFENSEPVGLGVDLPPGTFRVYQQARDGTVLLKGESSVGMMPAQAEAHVELGPAPGLLGERERTGYREVKPLHEYEETFEIRLSNETDEDVVVRVVEHLYRWHEFEIVKADTEYQLLSSQMIEFRPTLKAGGKRSVHYTVRYSW